MIQGSNNHIFFRSVRKMKKQAQNITIVFILTLFAFIFTFPMFFTVLNSFMSNEEIEDRYSVTAAINYDPPNIADNHFMNIGLIPDEVTIKQYYIVLIDKTQYLVMFWNSIKIVLPVICGQIIVSCMAAYSFSILKFRGKDSLFFIYIVVMLMPFQVTLVPNYIIAAKLHLVGSYLSIIFPGIFNTFGVFLLRQYISYIPNTYTEAAKIDGAGCWNIFANIIVPMSKTGIAALAILTFIDNWNMVEQPLIFIKDVLKEPLSIYLSALNEKEKGVAFAASVFYMLPMLLSFLYWEDHLVEGIELSGIKA